MQTMAVLKSKRYHNCFSASYLVIISKKYSAVIRPTTGDNVTYYAINVNNTHTVLYSSCTAASNVELSGQNNPQVGNANLLNLTARKYMYYQFLYL